MNHSIKNKLLELHTTPWGASMTAIWTKDRNGGPINIIYGYENEEEYRRNPLFLGATCGRYAGRIGGHAFTIGETNYPLESSGKVHLHGGKHTLGLKKWSLKEIRHGEHPRIVYRIQSPHLEGGYPGNLVAEACYSLEGNTLRITYTAHSDRDTFLNLTNHNYYNLDGGGSVASHRLFAAAGQYLETDPLQIPTGKRLSMEGSPLDHRIEKPMEATFSEIIPDHTYSLNDDRREAATLYSPKSGIHMALYTNQPGLVIYTPEYLPEEAYKNAAPGKYPSICLETQQFPNAPNIPDFPSALLKKGETYHNESILEFTIK